MNFSTDQKSDLGIIIYSKSDGEFFHIFVYQPLSMSQHRLMNENADDIYPAVHPDGTKIAFSSNRSGFWDLYILDLTNGKVDQLTNTPEYDGAPTWSPDGKWIAFESYLDENLEIQILSLDTNSQPIRLTESSASDHSPSWSPNGRDIAFVSNRSGENEIWLAKLDQTDQRFFNISQNPTLIDNDPDWSPDGSSLVWTANENGVDRLYYWEETNKVSQPFIQVSGTHPCWGSFRNAILTQIINPNQFSIAILNLDSQTWFLAPQPINGTLQGMDWQAENLPAVTQNYPFPADSDTVARPIWEQRLSSASNLPAGRYSVSKLGDVSAPYPYLHDQIDESFTAMRKMIGQNTGWDFLASLENAYLPVSEPATLDIRENWLYTARAIDFNTMPMYAGWLVTVREDIGGDTFWRVFIRARKQDGSQGMPLRQCIWDFNARYSGSTETYEKGGECVPPPPGYWVDFTEIALRFNWNRVPALGNWKTFFPAARFNQIINNENLSWEAAMSQILPPEALITATYIPTRTPAPPTNIEPIPTAHLVVTQTP
jgi:TolB protein